jgi:hypothetical protein
MTPPVCLLHLARAYRWQGLQPEPFPVSQAALALVVRSFYSGTLEVDDAHLLWEVAHLADLLQAQHLLASFIDAAQRVCSMPAANESELCGVRCLGIIGLEVPSLAVLVAEAAVALVANDAS